MVKIPSDISSGEFPKLFVPTWSTHTLIIKNILNKILDNQQILIFGKIKIKEIEHNNNLNVFYNCVKCMLNIRWDIQC